MSRLPMASGSFFVSVGFLVSFLALAGVVWSCWSVVVWSCASAAKENRLSAARIATGVLHGWLIVRDSCIATLYALSLRGVWPIYINARTPPPVSDSQTIIWSDFAAALVHAEADDP